MTREPGVEGPVTAEHGHGELAWWLTDQIPAGCTYPGCRSMGPHNSPHLIEAAHIENVRRAARAEVIAEGKLDLEVFNPARNADGDTTRPWSWYIRLDVAMLLQVDAIAMLPGWETSRGAKLERAIADALELPVFDAEFPWEATFALLPPTEPKK